MFSKSSKHMLLKDNSHFYDFMKPLNYFNGFMGLGFCRQPDTSNAAYLLMRVYMIFAMILNWVVTYIGLSVLIENNARLENTAMARTMYNMLITTNSCIAVTAPVLIWLRRKDLTKCLREMPILDLNFQSVVGARNEYRKRCRNLSLKISVIMLVAIFLAICDTAWMTIGERSLWIDIFVIITLHYPIIVLLLLDLNFCTFVCVAICNILSSYVGNKFQEVNKGLLNLVENPHASISSKRLFVVSRNVVWPTRGDGMKNNEVAGSMNDNELKVLHEIRRVHLQLCKLSRKLNQVFGIQNLLSMGISFAMITALLYNVYSTIVQMDSVIKKFQQGIPSMIWVLIYAFKIWSVNHTCSVVSRESERTGDVIYELLKPRIDRELQKEVQEFGVQMLQNPVRFDACGFFTLDYTFVQGVIGSITTYLVILIQMSEVYETTKSSTSCNSTSHNCTDV